MNRSSLAQGLAALLVGVTFGGCGFFSDNEPAPSTSIAPNPLPLNTPSATPIPDSTAAPAAANVTPTSTPTPASMPGATPAIPSSAAPPGSPRAVAEAYLRAGDNADAARAQVEPRCHGNDSLTKVAAARMLGIPITPTSITTEEHNNSGDRTNVHYQIKGSVRGGGATKMGPLSINVQNVTMDDVTKSGDIQLAKSAGRWMVTCP